MKKLVTTITDFILAKYWTPKGTPQWRHHLPAILISLSLIMVGITVGLLTPQGVILCAILLPVIQFLFAYFARMRFGHYVPKYSRYYKK